MNQGIFIQTNDNQLVGAKVAKYALETRGHAIARGIPITIMNVDEMPLFHAFAGVTFRRGTEMRSFDPSDLQSFTLSRFMPPELMGYSGRALVIDPDVFALDDVGELFATDMQDAPIAACPRNYGWDTSVMLLDCSKLKHWKLADILADLNNLKLDYNEFIRLKPEPKVQELPKIWNMHDDIGSTTKMLHTTRRLTQPWKTGLPVDFTVGKTPPLFGFIPIDPVRRLLFGSKQYRPHPKQEVIKTFLNLLKEARSAGAVTEANLADAIARKFVRPDIRELLA